MSSAHRVGIVVVNWQRRAATHACLHALQGMTYTDWFLVLVDNESDDFSAAELQTLAPEAHYVRTTTNLGFAGGSNLGMRTALDAGAALVWFLNNDAEPAPDALSVLVERGAADATVGVAGAKILRGSDPTRLDSVALDVNLHNGRVYLTGHDELDRAQYDTLTEPVAVSGCAMLVRRVVCEELRGFDERYFAYLEDADLCLRARAAGFRVVVVPTARVLHQRAQATADRQSVSSLYYTTRNHLRLVDEHGDGGPLRRLLRRLTVVGLNLAYAIRSGSGRASRIRAVCRGVVDYHRGIVGRGRI